MKCYGQLLVGLVASASASYTGNLNYFSPSLRHPSLGVSIRKVAARTYAASPWEPSQLSFTHGVASGDPTADSVILWTRAAPIGADTSDSNVTVSGTVPLYSHENDEFVQQSAATVCVEWKVGQTEDLRDVVSSGSAYTSSDIDFTVKVEAKNLKSLTMYHYRFNICGSNNTSAIGRTKTLPTDGAKVMAPIRLAVYSCSNFPKGFFNAYGNVVRKDSVDYVIHLGDYIYEYGSSGGDNGQSFGRIPLPEKEITTLCDYRKRLATYRTDPDLLANHQHFAWISVWDDHEVADNTYRDGTSKMNNTEDSFNHYGGVSFDQRKANAVRAYFEWMPLRQVDMDDNLRIWRDVRFGDLFDLLMLDTRQYDRSVTDLSWNTEYISQIANDQGRSLMGARQEQWFHRSLKDSALRGTCWRVVGSQVVFASLNLTLAFGDSFPVNLDSWDGYLASKNRTLATLFDNGLNNNVFLAGDSHASWVSDLAWIGNDAHPYDSATGAGSVGVEFAGTAVSSPNPSGAGNTLAESNRISELLTRPNPELQWQDLYYRGYYELSIGYNAVNASFFGMPDLSSRNGFEVSLANFTVLAGENRLQRFAAAASASAATTVTRSGSVDSGSLKGGKVLGTNFTYDTGSGERFVYSG